MATTTMEQLQLAEAHVGSLRRQIDMPRMKVSEAARRYGRLCGYSPVLTVSIATLLKVLHSRFWVDMIY